MTSPDPGAAETVCVADAADPTLCAQQLAWSLDDEDDTAGARSWGLSRGQSAVLVSIAVLMVASVVGIVGWALLRSERGARNPVPVTTTISAAAPTLSGTVAAASPSPPAMTGTPDPTPVDEPNLDVNDRAFFQALRRAEVVIPDQPKALAGAHWVCGKFRDGYSRADVVTMLKKNNPELTELGAVDFMAASVVFYCPQYA